MSDEKKNAAEKAGEAVKPESRSSGKRGEALKAAKKTEKTEKAEKTEKTEKMKSTSRKTSRSAVPKTTKDKKFNTETEISGYNALKIEICAIAVIGICILLIISLYFGGGGVVGSFFNRLLKGLFGVGAFVLPPVLICLSAYLLLSKRKKVNIIKAVSAIFMFLALIGFTHMINREVRTFSNASEYVSVMFANGTAANGGLLGAAVGDALMKVFGRVGAYVVIVLLIICLTIVMTGKSFFDFLHSLFLSLSAYVTLGFDDDNDDYEDDLYIEENEEEIPVKHSIFSIAAGLFSKKQSYDEYEAYEEPIQDIPAPRRYVRKKTLGVPERRPIRRKMPFERYNVPKEVQEEYYQRQRCRPVIINIKKDTPKKDSRKISLALDEIKNSGNITEAQDSFNKTPSFFKREENIALRSREAAEKIIKEEKLPIIHGIKPPESEPSLEKQEQGAADITAVKAIVKLSEFDELYQKDKIPSAKEIYELFSDERLNEIAKHEKALAAAEAADIIEEGRSDGADIIEESSIEGADIIEEGRSDGAGQCMDDGVIILELDGIDSAAGEEREEHNPENNNADEVYESLKPNHYTEYKKKFEQKQERDDMNEALEKAAMTAEIYKSREAMPIIVKSEKPVIVDKLQIDEEQKHEYVFPKLEFLEKNPVVINDANEIELLENSRILVKTLRSFNIETEVKEISKGPTVTRYELAIEEGVKVSRVTGLADNLALSLAAMSIRIEAPIPGKAAVGIEIPNKEVLSVYLSEVVCSEKFQKFKSKLAFGLGKDIAGNVVVTDIARMPHLLIAGATGSGKSVCINTLITSILYKATPDEVRLILVDPKVVELSVYNDIPHLLVPVITEPDKASAGLNWAVSEMMERYKLFEQTKSRNLKGYNRIMEESGGKKLPQIMIIIDELADLMMAAAKEVEASICRLAQLARAAGIHLVIATQRPSTDVITGLIKANIPSRIAFKTSNGIDSRTILDSVGAEKLIGRGDMLLKTVEMGKALRVQCAFISDQEIEKIVDYTKQNNPVSYDDSVMDKISKGVDSVEDGGSGVETDELTNEVIQYLVMSGKGSTSMIQRKFKIGYNRAARIMEELEDRGIVGKENGSKPREILMDKYQMEDYFTRNS